MINYPNPKARPTRRGSRQWRVAGAVVAVVMVIVAGWRVQASPRFDTGRPGVSSGTVVPISALGERRPTLDPAEFTGRAAIAYQIAREIPDTLDHLHCYCECDKFLDHKSLLSCYVDYPAAT